MDTVSLDMIDWRDPIGCRLWIAFEPDGVSDPEAMLAILLDLAGTMSEFAFLVDVDDDMRTYKLTPRGISGLRKALVRNPRQGVSLRSEVPAVIDKRGAVAEIDAEDGPDPTVAYAVQVSITRDASADDDLAPIANQLRAFARAWIDKLPAIAAFISDSTLDWPSVTHFESTQKAVRRRHWPVANMPVRGAFWSNYIGSDLCERLGGVEHILANAPVPIREPLGGGVWLQCSEHPSATEQQIEDLLTFFAPGLVRPNPNPSRRLEPQAYTPPVIPEGLPPDDAPGVPVEALPDAEVSEDLPFTVYLAAPLTDAAQHAVTEAVNRWNQAGEAQAYGGSGFATLIGPHVDPDDASMRWMVDLGWCDPEVAVNALARILYAVPGQSVSRLVIGWETVE